MDKSLMKTWRSVADDEQNSMLTLITVMKEIIALSCNQ